MLNRIAPQTERSTDVALLPGTGSFLQDLSSKVRGRVFAFVGALGLMGCHSDQGVGPYSLGSDTADSADVPTDPQGTAPVVQGEINHFIEIYPDGLKGNEGPEPGLEALLREGIFSDDHQAGSSFTGYAMASALAGVDVVELNPATTANEIKETTMPESDRQRTTGNILMDDRDIGTGVFYINEFVTSMISDFDAIHRYTETESGTESYEQNDTLMRDAKAFIKGQMEAGLQSYTIIAPFTPHTPHNQTVRPEDIALLAEMLSDTRCPWVANSSDFADKMNTSEFGDLSDDQKRDCIRDGNQAALAEVNATSDLIVTFLSDLRDSGHTDVLVSVQADHGSCTGREIEDSLQLGGGGIAEFSGKWGNGQSVSWCEIEGFWGVLMPGVDGYEVEVRTAGKDAQCTVLSAAGIACPGTGRSILEVQEHPEDVLASLYCYKNRGHAVSTRKGNEDGNSDNGHEIARDYTLMESQDGAEPVREYVSIGSAETAYTQRTDPPPSVLTDALNQKVAMGLEQCVR